MRVAIMQPYFFPYLMYWKLIAGSDIFVIYDDVDYIKRGYINRNQILINQLPSYITIPVKRVSRGTPINKVNISPEYSSDELIKKIERSYKKSKNFDYFFPILERVLDNQEKELSVFLKKSIVAISDYLNIKTKIILSSGLEKNNSLKGQDKILNICEILKCTSYINASGGESLYDEKVFLEKGMSLNFLKNNLREYRQFKSPFVPNLSVIDVLMFNEKKEVIKSVNNIECI